MNLAECLDKIDRMASLEKGWDSYKAPAIDKVARDNAADFCRSCAYSSSCMYEPSKVAPSSVGAVAVCFYEGDREVYVEFYNRGTCAVLFSDDRTEKMDTRMVETNVEGYRKLLDDVERYLSGEWNAAD
jgi:hypothetical protein